MTTLDKIGALAVILAQTTDPDQRATLASAIADVTRLAELDAKVEAQRERARDKKRRQRSRVVPACPRDSGGQEGTVPPPPPSPQVSLLPPTPPNNTSFPSPPATPNLPPSPANAGSGGEGRDRSYAEAARDPVFLAEQTALAPAPGAVLKPRRTRRTNAAAEQTPKPEAVPAVWLDYLHGQWTKLGGVVELPRFRRGAVSAIRGGFTVGQIARAAEWWIAARQKRGKPMAWEYFLAELGATVREVDQGGVIFALKASDLGLSSEGQAARQAAYLARLRAEDEAFMQALLTTPAPDPVTPDAQQLAFA